MEAFFTYIVANWPTIVAGILAFFGSVDKIGLMFFKTAENLFKYYRESFPKKEEKDEEHVADDSYLRYNAPPVSKPIQPVANISYGNIKESENKKDETIKIPK